MMSSQRDLQKTYNGSTGAPLHVLKEISYMTVELSTLTCKVGRINNCFYKVKKLN